MSLVPFEKLHYAETHFKFKLPWSLLYKPWPEIITDAPFQFVPDIKPHLWIIVRNGDRFPIKITKIKIEIQKISPEKKKTVQTFENLNLSGNKDFSFFKIELESLDFGNYELFPYLTISKNKKSKEILRWNLPHLKPKPLKIKILREVPPKPFDFAAGEMHCHSYYSKDHVEYGASPLVMQDAAKSIGLDFVNFTDHAYDFQFLKEDYTKEATSPIPRFEELKNEIQKLPSKPLLIVSEEVSVGNSKNENVHLILLEAEEFLPGLGDCGRYWLNNKPTLPIGKILEMTNSPCFAAHPLQQMSGLERFIFRRGYWNHRDLHLDNKKSIRGLQFWNGVFDDGFYLGKKWWIEELGKGHFLLPIGGNDAHGDLNDTTYVKMPLVSLGNNRHHVFGKVRTVIKVENKNKITNKLTINDLKEAFQNDNCYITNGPALWWDRNNSSIIFHAQSNKDLGGGFKYIKIFGRKISPNGNFSKNEELLKESLVWTREKEVISIESYGYAYLRAEAETADGFFALTSAARINSL